MWPACSAPLRTIRLDEDVIPKWLLRILDLEESSTTASVAEEAGDKQQIGALRDFQVTLNAACAGSALNERHGSQPRKLKAETTPRSDHHPPRPPAVPTAGG
jgi:hypothetical protein